jgi:hypothetical protein
VGDPSPVVVCPDAWFGVEVQAAERIRARTSIIDSRARFIMTSQSGDLFRTRTDVGRQVSVITLSVPSVESVSTASPDPLPHDAYGTGCQAIAPVGFLVGTSKASPDPGSISWSVPPVPCMTRIWLPSGDHTGPWAPTPAPPNMQQLS